MALRRQGRLEAGGGDGVAAGLQDRWSVGGGGGRFTHKKSITVSDQKTNWVRTEKKGIKGSNKKQIQ